MARPPLKPIGPSVINYGHPIARQLRDCFLFQDRILVNLGGRFLFIEGASFPSIEMTDIGPVASFTAASSEFIVTSSGNDIGYDDNGSLSEQSGSIFVILRSNDDSTGRYLCGQDANTIVISHSGSNDLRFQYGDIADDILIENNTFFQGEWYALMGSWDGANDDFWAHSYRYSNQVASTGSVQAGTTRSTSNGEFAIGHRDSFSGNYWDGYIACFYMWDRAIKFEEFLELAEDPYQMIEPAIGSYFIAAAAAGGIIPQVMHHRRIMEIS